MRLFGKPGKAGKEQRPEQVPAGAGGRASGGNVFPGPAIMYGPQPQSVSLATRLHIGTSLTSPMVAGRYRPGDQGAATRRGCDGGSPDLGALQAFRGLVGGPGRAQVGAQAGPSAQPGYPSTGGGPLLDAFARMSQPDVQPYGGIR
ncbi:hypothetical protein C5N14_30920 [Micromonospora sp. MW-13]|uniref:hypothetical protein n=1 Tax=Micromonospora sp. MW-13 TaxID=2094022 RepID=UPI000E45166D|nr:hypothetical protein [Micromonospora sp. MW-13]RGC65006.1 hypothetical protein C5N14_30920 [Micromonospora sp. MW-13]